MNFLFISIEESFFIIFMAIIVFGPKKIPDIARGMGNGIRYLKNAKNKIKNEIMKNILSEKEPTSNNEKKKSKIHSSVKRN
ncbi:putative Sec-independent-protein-translocase protein TatA/E [Blattabacterium sp. (Mastotermes darwiniensis) str. MADAR]|jgi:sec-independent protein translocase protein TatA|nr:putative Sec-independent-protein-translocase protein TatA/E [Blattabacterium sp. (Mastotermes darwiniensis) str. MADAR]